MGESVRDGLDRSRPVPYSDGRSESTPYIEGKYPTRKVLGKAGVNTLGVLGAGTVTGRDAGPYILGSRILTPEPGDITFFKILSRVIGRAV